ncbi:MAG: hypothetical protein MJ146_02240 [Clostridia bacterium]|nr:hypothetical protein [Clostridia bacterium]
MGNLMDLTTREDRIGEYLYPHIKTYVFDELSRDYLKKNDLLDILAGIPIPINTKNMTGLNSVEIAINMAFVMGVNPTFEHNPRYVKYIERKLDPLFMEHYSRPFVEYLVSEGISAAEKKDYDVACIFFRAALVVDPNQTDALYCYARACKDSYELGEDEDYVARFKAESIEAFEYLTLEKPDFADAYYYLGYGYLNLGLYIKAKLTFEEFLKKTDDEELKKEVSERLATLDDPIEIEQGYNMIATGKFEEGYEKLSQYKEGPFSNWWPLWYYLGIAAKELGLEEAEEDFLKVLTLSPSNIETMKELVNIYKKNGDSVKQEKYLKKIEICEGNMAEDAKKMC